MRPDGQPVVLRDDVEAHVDEASQQVLHVFGPSPLQEQLATGHRNRGDVGGGLDAVGDRAVVGGAQRSRLDTVHDERRRSDAFDVCAHRDQHGAQVGDLGLARRVVDDGGAFGMNGRRQDVFGGTHARELKSHVGAVQAIGTSFDVAVGDLECGAHRLEAAQVHVDGARSKVVAAWQ